MNRNLVTAAVAVVAAFAVGWACSSYGSGKGGGVAVVDLDEVARQLGRNEQMANSVRATAGSLQNELTKAGQQLNALLAQERKKWGDQPSQEDAQKYLQTQRAAQLKYNQFTQQVQTALDQTRVKLVADFRETTRPHAQKVAKDMGLNTVFTKNDAVVFAFDDAVDITDEVIALMKAEGLAAAPAATPAAPASDSPAPAYAPDADSQVVPASATAPAQEASAVPAAAAQ